MPLTCKRKGADCVTVICGSRLYPIKRNSFFPVNEETSCDRSSVTFLRTKFAPFTLADKVSLRSTTTLPILLGVPVTGPEPVAISNGLVVRVTSNYIPISASARSGTNADTSMLPPDTVNSPT